MDPPIILVLLMLSTPLVTGLSMESCDTSANEVVINPLAQAQIAVVLPLRGTGSNG